MPLRTLARFLANEHLVERLANSYVIRRLAQLTHYSYMRFSQAGQKSIDKYSKKEEFESRKNGSNPNAFMFGRFFSRFIANLQKEIEKNNRK